MNQGSLDKMWAVMKVHDFQTSDDSGSEFKCTICNKIMINACIAPCRCQFCLDCINEYLKNGKRKCPGRSRLCDMDKIDVENDILINRLINIQISKLPVKCPNIDCQSRVELKTIADHLMICENQPQSCPYISLGCEEKQLRKDKVKDHLNVEIGAHSHLIIDWMNNYRNEIDSLKRDVVRLREENEELKEKMISGGERMQKQERESSSQIQKLHEEMCDVKNSNRDTQEELKSFKENQTIKISQFETILKDQNEEIHRLKSQISSQNNEIETLRQQCNEIQGQVEERHVELDEISQAYASIQAEQMEAAKSILSMKEIVDRTTVGEFEWIIDNWTEKSRNAQNGIDEEIFSEPFLTHREGYKICLVLMPHAKHFGFRIMRGPFDEMLWWPFNRIVEFSFINQKTGGVHKTFTRKCLFYYKNEELQKPNDENTNKPFYYNFLCNLQRPITPEVIQNDRIFIRFSTKPVDHK